LAKRASGAEGGNMKCVEAAEFVSALCDGQQIPRDAAEHIGACEPCRALLREYTEMGAEMRRVACLSSNGVTKTNLWVRETQRLPSWWGKARASMRIPKFAFALLLLAIAALGSSLAIVKAQSRALSEVLVFDLDLPRAEHPLHGAVYVNRGRDNRGMTFTIGTADPLGMLKAGLRILENDGSRLKIGAHSHFYPGTLSMTMRYDDSVSDTEKQYEFVPGTPLEMDIEGVGRAKLTGQVVDYMPVFSTAGETLMPAPGELRILAPLLLKGEHLVLDGAGGRISNVEMGMGFLLYTPGSGCFALARAPFPGAVEGRVEDGRVNFEMNGEHYPFVTAAAMTRADTLWVRFGSKLKPSELTPELRDDNGSFGMFRLSAAGNQAR
jgi:hypothetical protein